MASVRELDYPVELGDSQKHKSIHELHETREVVAHGLKTLLTLTWIRDVVRTH